MAFAKIDALRSLDLQRCLDNTWAGFVKVAVVVVASCFDIGLFAESVQQTLATLHSDYAMALDNGRNVSSNGAPPRSFLFAIARRAGFTNGFAIPTRRLVAWRESRQVLVVGNRVFAG
jgi:hypothetical protein